MEIQLVVRYGLHHAKSRFYRHSMCRHAQYRRGVVHGCNGRLWPELVSGDVQDGRSDSRIASWILDSDHHLFCGCRYLARSRLSDPRNCRGDSGSKQCSGCIATCFVAAGHSDNLNPGDRAWRVGASLLRLLPIPMECLCDGIDSDRSPAIWLFHCAGHLGPHPVTQ